MSSFEGSTIVITGGESGIGRGSVEYLAREGAHVWIGGILEDEAQKTIEATTGLRGTVKFQKTDVRDSSQVNALIDGAHKASGRLDGLVNCAAIFDGFASCLDTSDALFDQIIGVNLRGTFLACRAALKHMVPAKNGKIVNVSSIGGLVGMADGASYTASKHGVVGLSKHLGCFYAKDGIGINCVCPGAIETNVRGNSARILGSDAPPMGGVGANTDWIKTAIPQQRKGKISEVTEMIAFLLSDKATYMNGQCFTVDGGWTAK